MTENKMKVYIASSWKNQYYDKVIFLVGACGYDVYNFRDPKASFNWATIDPNWKEWSNQQYITNLDNPKAKKGFKRDFNALLKCDICILVCPCGRSAHLELGFASGAHKHTIIFIPENEKQEPELMYKLADKIITTFRDLDRELCCLKEYRFLGMEIGTIK